MSRLCGDREGGGVEQTGMQKDTHLCTAGISKPTATQSTDTAESYSLLAIWPPAVRGN